jgi:hypothetical protein
LSQLAILLPSDCEEMLKVTFSNTYATSEYATLSDLLTHAKKIICIECYNLSNSKVEDKYLHLSAIAYKVGEKNRNLNRITYLWLISNKSSSLKIM